MDFICYILYSATTDKYYIGSCADINIRLQQHNAGRTISTKSGIPWVVVYKEHFGTNTDARNRELELKKKKSRKYLEWLISSIG